MRLRLTALPVFLLAVRPNLIGVEAASSAMRWRACKTSPRRTCLSALAAAKKSRRTRKVDSAGPDIFIMRLRQTGFCGHVRDDAPEPDGRLLWPCANGNHGGVCAPDCSVGKSFSPVPLLHGGNAINQHCTKPCISGADVANNGRKVNHRKQFGRPPHE